MLYLEGQGEQPGQGHLEYKGNNKLPIDGNDINHVQGNSANIQGTIPYESTTQNTTMSGGDDNDNMQGYLNTTDPDRGRQTVGHTSLADFTNFFDNYRDTAPLGQKRSISEGSDETNSEKASEKSSESFEINLECLN